MTSCEAAIKAWEEESKESAADARKVMLYCQIPPITKMDGNLNNLKKCQHLSLSTNSIEKFGNLALPELKVLSIGRNHIKKIDKIESIAGTLEELWMSYNVLQSLDGLASCKKLQVLYISNNKIKSWDELDKLQANPELRDILLIGNPIYDNMSTEQQRVEVLKHLPNLQKIDGVVVTPGEREAASNGGDVSQREGSPRN
jgi:dynein light chain 1, axonemal